MKKAFFPLFIIMILTGSTTNSGIDSALTTVGKLGGIGLMAYPAIKAAEKASAKYFDIYALLEGHWDTSWNKEFWAECRRNRHFLLAGLCLFCASYYLSYRLKKKSKE